jgi:cytochrome c oxidase subunit 2
VRLLLAVDSPSPLSPAGSEADRVATLLWIVLALGVFVVVVVLTAVLVAMFRRQRDHDTATTERTHQRFIVGGGIVFPVVILSVVGVLTVVSTATLLRSTPGALTVDVTGEQWFWRISYPDSGITTANELRVPVDRSVELHLHSSDVVHSFWVPQLAGKLDATPGQSPVLAFTPHEVGTYRGECAEFCGLQHANMNFVVDVLSQADFDSWVQRHRETPAPPTDQLAAEGRADFASLACAGCHTIRGVSDGTFGPDLTDIGERSTLGASTVPNTDEDLAAWMVNARAFKPGVKMPPIDLTNDQVHALVAYLRTLR